MFQNTFLFAPRNTLKINEHNCISRVSTSWSLNVWSFVCGHSHPIIVYFLIPFIPWPSVSRLEERYFLGVFRCCFEISEIPKVINKHRISKPKQKQENSLASNLGHVLWQKVFYHHFSEFLAQLPMSYEAKTNGG